MGQSEPSVPPHQEEPEGVRELAGLGPALAGLGPALAPPFR